MFRFNRKTINVIYTYLNQMWFKYIFLIKLLNSTAKDYRNECQSAGEHCHILHNMWQRTLHKSDMLFSLRNKNQRRENHSGRTTRFLALSEDRDVLFRGHFQERRDATWRDAERTPPLKSQLFCWSLVRARTQIGAGDLFSDDRGVPGATFTRGALLREGAQV